MTFSTTSDKQDPIKFALVRTTVGRAMAASLTGGPVYQCTWTRPVNHVERNGVTLTKDTALPTVADHWWYDETNSIFYVKLAAVANDTTNIVVVYYYLFATSGEAIDAYEDPLDSSTTVRTWEPRLVTEPRVRQSLSNVISGVFSIENTSIDFTNADNFYNQFTTSDDSWYEKDVDVWFGMRATEAATADYQRTYKGKTKSFVLDRRTLSINVADAFSRLSHPALMGDSGAEVFVSNDAGSYPLAQPQAVGKIVPYHLGSFSRYATKNDANTSGYYVMDYATMPAAFCSSMALPLTTSVNRTWICGRCQGLRTWSIPQPDAGVIFAAGYISYAYSLSAWNTITGNPAIGDRVKIVDTGVTFYGRISDIGDGSVGHRGVTFHLDSTGTPTGSATPTITCYTDPALILVDSVGNEYPLSPGRDYNYGTGTTTGGNTLVRFVFVNNFEANLTTGNNYATTYVGPLNPQQNQIYYRMRLATTSANHADVLSAIMGFVGLTVASASFTTAKAALAVNAYFSIPFFDETALGDYVSYVGAILQSTLGILYLDSSVQVNYLLLAAPSSADTTDDNVVLEDSDSITVEYQDIVTDLVLYNPHNQSAAAVAASPSPSVSVSNAKAKYLHGVYNVKLFRHVLETITARSTQLINALSNRRATYQWNTAAKFLDAYLGQDTLAATTCLLGADTTKAVKILSIDRSADAVTVGAIDLQGVT